MGTRPRRPQRADDHVRGTRATRRAPLLLAAMLWLASCSNLSDRGLAARAGDWTLTEERLAELLVLAQPFPLDSVAVAPLVDLWVASAALSQRAAAGDSLQGAEAREASTWLERREAILSADRRERLSASIIPRVTEAETVFSEGSLRLIAHVLRRVGPETSSSERLLQQRTADRLLATIAEGGGWATIVAESEDIDSRSMGGLLGLFGPGELPTTLERAAFRLEPGQVSAVTQSAQGFHILYRPRYAEVETILRERLFDRLLMEADAGAAAGVRGARNFTVSPGAEVVVARVAEDPAEWLDSRQVLASWDGGSYAAGTAARDFFFFPRETLTEISGAEPEARTALINDLGTRELRLVDAAEGGMTLDPLIEDMLARGHDEELEYWTRVLDLNAADSPSRTALARYMESVVARREEARTMPPLFEAWLLGRTDTRVRHRGILAAIVTAQGMLRDAGTSGGAGT